MGNQQMVTYQYKISGLVIVDVLKLYHENSMKIIRDPEQIKILISETFKLLLKKNLEIDEETEPMVTITLTKQANDNILDTPYLYQFDIDLKLMIQSAFFSVNTPKLFCQNAQQNVQKYQINDFFSQHGEVKLMVNFWENNEQQQNNEELRQSAHRKSINMNLQQQRYRNKQNLHKDLQQKLNLGINEEEEEETKENQSVQINPKQSTLNSQNSQILNESLEITEEYFNAYYKRLTNIQEGGFGEVALYYDSNLHKLLAVKSLKKAHTHTNELLAIERERVLTAIRGINLTNSQRFQDQKIRGLRRNIVREIKLTYVGDDTNTYHRINKLEGVVYFESSQTFQLVFEFFGNLLFQDNRLHCDLLDFIFQFKENKHMFKQMPSKSKTDIIRTSFSQLLKAVDFLHNQKDMVIRDLKDTNVLMKRVFNKDRLGESIYQTQIIDFGMSKDLEDHTDETEVADELSEQQSALSRTSSISIQASHQGRHPKFLFNQKLLYDKKDDVFALGSLLYRLYQLFGLGKYIGSDIKDFIVKLTGIKFLDFQRYFYLIDQDQFQQAKSLFNEKDLIESQQNVMAIEDIIKLWDQVNVESTKFLAEKKSQQQLMQQQ